tara:strand:- start:421 stop:1092 length:672 start_codon:yes stop_codon:yes gene_type:complete
MNYTNYFDNLYNSEDEKKPSPKNLHRKAIKMIDQINKLKTKNSTELNDDQINKLKTEYYWRKVLDPSYISHEEKCKIDDEKKRHYEKKQKLREKKEKERMKQDKKERERERQHKQREHEQRERQHKQRERDQREREYEQREREYEQREREHEQREREQQSYNKKSTEEKKIDIEFNLLISQGKSFDYARKKILLKYHPDKNKNENAHRITQIINNKRCFEYSI